LCRSQFSTPALVDGSVAGLCRGDGVGDQRMLAAVETGERAGDRVLDRVGIDPLRATSGGVVPVSCLRANRRREAAAGQARSSSNGYLSGVIAGTPPG
jgi:hypothetical protein